MADTLNIEADHTYYVRVWDDESHSYWEGTFTVHRFLKKGPYAGAYWGYDDEGFPAIIEPEEFVSEV